MGWSSGDEYENWDPPDYDSYDSYEPYFPTDLSDWTDQQDSDSQQRRSGIVHKVLKNGDVEQLRTILERGWDVNEELTGYTPRTPLLHAITESRNNQQLLKIIQLLLEHGANLHVTDNVNIGLFGKESVQSTALHKAARLGYTAVVKVLLEAGAKYTSDGIQSPLLQALQGYNCPPALIDLLLTSGADPNNHDDQLENIPLLKAIETLARRDEFVEEKNTLIIKLLLEHGANPNVASGVDIGGYRKPLWVQRTALHQAARHGLTEVVKMLLDAGAKCSPSDGLENPLALALQRGGCPTDLLEMLLKHGADPNYHKDQPGNIPLVLAISNGRCSQNVNLLLEHGANPNLSHRVDIGGYKEPKWVNRTALQQAARQGWTDGVKVLLEAGAQCTTSDGLQNPLALAIQQYHCSQDLIDLLLKHGTDPNDHDDNPENVPLLKAITNVRASQNDTSIVQLLLAAGAKCKTSQNPLMLAISKDTCPPDLIEMLLKHGADPNDHDHQFKNIPLLRAIQSYGSRRKNDTIIKLLIENGANPNVVAKLASDSAARLKSLGLVSPLVLLLENPDCPSELITMLLEHGADPNYPETARHILLVRAITTCRNELHLTQIVQLLLKHGANPNVTDWVNKGDYYEDKLVQTSAVHEAARRQCTEVVKMLLEAGAICMPSGSLENSLALALQKPNCPSDLIQLLLQHGADPNDHDDQLENIPLLRAIENISHRYSHNEEQLLIVKLLLQHGANPNVSSSINVGVYQQAKGVKRTALQQAAREGLTKVVKILLEAGAKCSTSDGLQNPLALALQGYECSTDLIELLLEHGADPNDHDDQLDNIPLLTAISKHSDHKNVTLVVKLLLEHGANPNVAHRLKTHGHPDKHTQRTAVHEAAVYGMTNVVKLLLEAGAEWPLSLQNQMGRVLQNYDCHPDLIELLLKHGADPNYHNSDQDAPLLCAVTHIHNESHLSKIVQLLLQHGANPNLTDKVEEEDYDKIEDYEDMSSVDSTEEDYEEYADVAHRLYESGYSRGRFTGWMDSMVDDPDYDEFLSAPYFVEYREAPYYGEYTDVQTRIKESRFSRRRMNKTALHEASRRGYTEIVKMLIDAGAKCTTSDGLENPLAQAVQGYNCPLDMIELLLKHGADPNDHDNQLENIPLLNAIKMGEHGQSNTSIIKCLLEHGANPNVACTMEKGYGQYKEVKTTALEQAVKQGWTEAVKLLLEAGGKFLTSDVLQNPLVMATQSGNCSPDLVELLIKHGADPNEHDDQPENIPLFNAIENVDVVKCLLGHGANPNVVCSINMPSYRGDKWVKRTALHQALIKGMTETVKVLLEAGAHCSTSGGLQNPLALVLQEGKCSKDLIELLLKHGIDPNYHDGQLDNIPLLIAISKHKQNEDVTIVQLLLEHGADPNVSYTRDIGGYLTREHEPKTALNKSLELGQNDVVKILLDAGAKPDASTLHNAVTRGWTEVVKMLFDAGVKCTTSDTFGNPLAVALESYCCTPDLIKLLLQHGADVKCKVAHGTPLIHKLANYKFNNQKMFLQQQLDLFFLHGGNINMKHGNLWMSLGSHGQTALEHTVSNDGHSNSVRWLIRHGADTRLKFSVLMRYFSPYSTSSFHEMPLILLQAGMRVSARPQTQIRNMEVAISTVDAKYGTAGDAIFRPNPLNLIRYGESEEEESEEEESEEYEFNLNKSTFPEDCTHQMADLQEFSDESLDMYPEKAGTSDGGDRREDQSSLEKIQKVLEFLSRPQSLQWYCRRCVRENLVSLQPSVIKTLPIPARLKRYILCHEI